MNTNYEVALSSVPDVFPGPYEEPEFNPEPVSDPDPSTGPAILPDPDSDPFSPFPTPLPVT